MIKYKKTILFCNFLLATFIGFAQETVNGDDVSAFVIGGGQVQTDASLTVNPVAILDVSPQGEAVIADGSEILREAGLAIFSEGIENFIPDIWINYTFRPSTPGTQAEIFVRTNQPIPDRITIRAQIVETSTGGNFEATAANTPIGLDLNNSLIIRSFDTGYTDDGQTNGFKVQYNYTNIGDNELPEGFAIIYEIIER